MTETDLGQIIIGGFIIQNKYSQYFNIACRLRENFIVVSNEMVLESEHQYI